MKTATLNTEKLKQEFENIKANLAWYDVEVVKENESWTDDEGEVVRLFDCIKGKEKVLAEFFTDSKMIDVYYADTDIDIYSGALKPVQAA